MHFKTQLTILGVSDANIDAIINGNLTHDALQDFASAVVGRQIIKCSKKPFKCGDTVVTVVGLTINNNRTDGKTSLAYITMNDKGTIDPVGVVDVEQCEVVFKSEFDLESIADLLRQFSKDVMTTNSGKHCAHHVANLADQYNGAAMMNEYFQDMVVSSILVRDEMNAVIKFVNDHFPGTIVHEVTAS